LTLYFPAKKSEHKKQNAKTIAMKARQDKREASIVPQPACNHFLQTQADLLSIYQQVINNPACMSLKPLRARN